MHNGPTTRQRSAASSSGPSLPTRETDNSTPEQRELVSYLLTALSFCICGRKLNALHLISVWLLKWVEALPRQDDASQHDNDWDQLTVSCPVMHSRAFMQF